MDDIHALRLKEKNISWKDYYINNVRRRSILNSNDQKAEIIYESWNSNVNGCIEQNYKRDSVFNSGSCFFKEDKNVNLHTRSTIKLHKSKYDFDSLIINPNKNINESKYGSSQRNINCQEIKLRSHVFENVQKRNLEKQSINPVFFNNGDMIQDDTGRFIGTRRQRFKDKFSSPDIRQYTYTSFESQSQPEMQKGIDTTYVDSTLSDEYLEKIEFKNNEESIECLCDKENHANIKKF